MTNFNLWYLLAPLFIMGSALLGALSITRKECKVYRRWNDKLASAIYTTAASITVAVLVLRESWRGLLQVGLNCLTPADSEFYGLCVSLVCYGAFVVVYVLVTAFAYIFGRDLHKNYSFAKAKAQREYCKAHGGKGIYCHIPSPEFCPCDSKRPIFTIRTNDLIPALMMSKGIFASQGILGLPQTFVADVPVYRQNIRGRVRLHPKAAKELRKALDAIEHPLPQYRGAETYVDVYSQVRMDELAS